MSLPLSDLRGHPVFSQLSIMLAVGCWQMCLIKLRKLISFFLMMTGFYQVFSLSIEMIMIF